MIKSKRKFPVFRKFRRRDGQKKLRGLKKLRIGNGNSKASKTARLSFLSVLWACWLWASVQALILEVADGAMLSGA